MAGKPITSFVQQGGGLIAEKAASRKPKDANAQKQFAAFQCAKKNLPDFFGYQVPQDLFKRASAINANAFTS